MVWFEGKELMWLFWPFKLFTYCDYRHGVQIFYACFHIQKQSKHNSSFLKYVRMFELVKSSLNAFLTCIKLNINRFSFLVLLVAAWIGMKSLTWVLLSSSLIVRLLFQHVQWILERIQHEHHRTGDSWPKYWCRRWVGTFYSKKTLKLEVKLNPAKLTADVYFAF